jgi:hypothetical protein
MERNGLLVLKLDVVSKAILRIVKAKINKQMPKINTTMVLHREETKMDAVMRWMVA